MKTLVTLSARFNKTPEGRIFPQNPTLNYSFFTRYLEVFESVLVLARVEEKSVSIDKNIGFSDGPGVSFLSIPCFEGIFSFIKDLYIIKKSIKAAVVDCQSYFMRVPDFLGTLVWLELRKKKFPFAIEVVGDPGESLKSGIGIKHFLLPVIRFFSILSLKLQCKEACAAAYVTKEILQRRYPTKKGIFKINYSSIDLPSSFYVKSHRIFNGPAKKLVYIGTLDVLYKGQDILIKALSNLTNEGHSFELTFVGDGRCREMLNNMVKKLYLSKYVSFIGRVEAGRGVASALDASDVFILPSHTEGLPKALIEAMARGLPAIATNVGGICELLPSDDLVPPGDPDALSKKILEVTKDPNRLTQMSKRNVEVANQYNYEIIKKKRNIFYQKVFEITEKNYKLKKFSEV
jgi:glycosyltransferase involved in cell wall biosynthesis